MIALHVRRAGTRRPGARPLVLLHGWSCHGGFFAPQFEALASETLVLAPDLPGHGLTGARVPRTIEAAADALADLLTAEDLSEVVLSGWSMGALVAFSLIERHGAGRLAALVVEDMTPKVLNEPAWALGSKNGLDDQRNAALLAALVPAWPAIAKAVAPRIFAEGIEPDPALLAFAAAEIGKADAVQVRDMWASLTAQDFRALLPEIDIPVVLVSGARSQLYDRAVAEWQAGRVPAARIAGFEHSGHAPHLEEPVRFNALLRDLIGRSG